MSTINVRAPWASLSASEAGVTGPAGVIPWSAIDVAGVWAPRTIPDGAWSWGLTASGNFLWLTHFEWGGDLAVPANRISGIINGTRAITADTALRLGKHFGVSPEIWLDLQSDYELRVARQTIWPEVEPSVKARVA